MHQDIDSDFVDPDYLDDEWWEKVNDYYEDYCALSAHMTDNINLRLIVQSFFYCYR